MAITRSTSVEHPTVETTPSISGIPIPLRHTETQIVPHKTPKGSRVHWCATVSILSDPWLINGDPPVVLSSHPALVCKQASSLMMLHSRSWDTEIISHLIELRDQ
uniref:Uncharacterized protein n=1 Tax=Cannabis sativa TaxID=3483 RepID=A0A803QG12_CANSA